jgi:hypothetical protein
MTTTARKKRLLTLQSGIKVYMGVRDGKPWISLDESDQRTGCANIHNLYMNYTRIDNVLVESEIEEIVTAVEKVTGCRVDRTPPVIRDICRPETLEGCR